MAQRKAPKLMKCTPWTQREFCEGSRPGSGTVRKWIERGVIEGSIIDGHVFVYENQKAGVSKDAAKLLKGLLPDG